MTKYSVMQPIEKDDKTFWHRVGTAFENPPRGDKGPTISVVLDSLPLVGRVVLFPDDGERNADRNGERNADRNGERNSDRG